MTYQTDIGLQTGLNVLPVKLCTASTDPQHEEARQHPLRSRPAQACCYHLKRKYMQMSGHENLPLKIGCCSKYLYSGLDWLQTEFWHS